MTQFHQEEQKRFEAEFPPVQNSRLGYVSDIPTAKQSQILEFLRKSNERAMKHILEELLAEIPEDEELSMDDEKSAEFLKIGINAERRYLRTLITKKLSDIALEE